MTIISTYGGSMPSLGDPANFNTNAVSFLDYLNNTFISELDALTLADFTGGDPATLTTLQLGNNTASTTTDLRLQTNSVISCQNSITHAFESGGHFRWMKDVTSYTGGTAGGTEIARMDASKFNIDLPLRGTGVLGTCAYSAANTGALFETGNNANGYYLRRADGVQICWHKLSVPFSGASFCQAGWTLPSNFVTANTMAVQATLGSVTGVTPGSDEIMPPRLVSVASSSVTVAVSRVTGGTNFQSGDTLDVYLTAIGRWRT